MAHLPEEDRASRIELDGDGDEEEERRQQEKSRAGGGDIEAAS